MGHNPEINSAPASFSRREFTRKCAIGTMVLAAPLLGFGKDKGKGKAKPKDDKTAPPRLVPINRIFPLDQDWLFGGIFNANALTEKSGDKHFSKVTLPHCVTKLSWQNWDPVVWENFWMYRRRFTLPKGYENWRVFVKFDGVMTGAKPVINGVSLPEHLGGFLPFRYELTQWLLDKDNVLDLTVDSRWQSVPPQGKPKGPPSCDYLMPGGIHRPVSLLAVPQVFISDVFAKPVKVLKHSRRVEILCSLDATPDLPPPLEVRVELMDGSRVISSDLKKVIIKQEGVTTVPLRLSHLGKIDLWSPDSPRLYDVVTTLLRDGKPLHNYRQRIGFREARFTKNGFFLNGKRLELFGLDRHEIYPYVGCAMPPRVTRRDAEIIRREFNCNMVRCSHYPQSEAFLDACDELGLMVWQEPPGWNYLGDEMWKELVVRDVREMIIRDRNHPSIIIWSVRVNESKNDPALYQRTKALAKSLDDTRQTSGSMTVHSTKNWFQDVFAMDDYHSAPDGSVGIEPPLPGLPYMLAETVGGFSYSAKKDFKNKYRRAGDLTLQMNQALYHAQAHDRAAAYPNFCGVIAWLAFDYGSLMNAYNAVKCPGVADVFRIPKLGAAFYQTQVSPKVRPLIIPSFYWDFGKNSPRGPGKQAAIFSNCDRLEISIAGQHLATARPDRKNYPHLLYPPFFCDLELDGKDHPELRIDGYAGDTLAVTRSFSADASQDQFYLAADDAKLIADGADATRLVFKVTDKYSSERAFATGKVTFEITGPGVIVGDNPFSLEDSGGVGAVWIKTVPKTTGDITVTATHSTLGQKNATISADSD